MKEEKLAIQRSRDTGLAFTLILGILFLIFKHQFLIIALIGSLVLTMVYPKWCLFLSPVWFGFSHVLGTIVSKVIFSIIFLFLATPIGLFRKMIKKDAMRLRLWKGNSNSVLVDRNHIYTVDDLKNPY